MVNGGQWITNLSLFLTKIIWLGIQQKIHRNHFYGAFASSMRFKSFIVPLICMNVKNVCVLSQRDKSYSVKETLGIYSELLSLLLRKQWWGDRKSQVDGTEDESGNGTSWTQTQVTCTRATSHWWWSMCAPHLRSQAVCFSAGRFYKPHKTFKCRRNGQSGS